MKRHTNHKTHDGDIQFDVNGGYSEGGWTVCGRHYERDAGVWRRYFPPGYAGVCSDDERAAVLTRMSPGARDWWVEWLQGPDTGQMIGPFPDKLSAQAAWVMLTKGAQ